MTRSTIRVCMAMLMFLGMSSITHAQTYPAATVIINGAQTGTANGTMTIAFNGHSETVSYGQFSTPTSIASAFAAEFSSYPASAWPRLCTSGVCAKASDSTIIFQLNVGASFGAITITSNSTTGTNPFTATVSSPSNISIVSSANPSVFGTPVTFTATVPSGATGNVMFYDGTNTPGSAAISGTAATYARSSLSVGSHSIIAVYKGDGSYSGSTSGLTQIVNQATPIVTLATSGTPAIVGSAITFTATVSGQATSTPTGNLTFYDGSTAIGTIQMSGTTAIITTSSLTVGTHTITASYAGDTNFASATSSALSQTLQAPQSAGGIITTVAGNGVPGYLGNGGAATSAELDAPSGVSVDANGNIYIADAAYGYIRKVSEATGAITTVAGNGGAYSSSGPATSTGVNAPFGVAVDAGGNIYIADTYDSRILKVNASTGILASIAGNGTAGYFGDGGAATSAELDNPIGVAVDGSGNIYIADGGLNRIRKVNAATGIITTIAGNGTGGYSGDGGAATSAELNIPVAVAVDSSGNIYIAEYSNNRIRKVNSAGIITTIAGNGTAGYSGDGSAATSAELNQPQGVYGDASGNIYIADGGNNRIRRVDAGGIITTVAGNGTAGYSGDGGVAINAELNFSSWGWAGVFVDQGGTIYIADQGNNRIRAVSPVNNALGITLATSGSPSVYGSPVTFTATAPRSDTNVVTFYSGSSPLGTAIPTNGIASFTTSSLAAGINPIMASIAAGGSYSAATSDLIDQVVSQLTSTISISNIPSNAGYGGSFTAAYAYTGNGAPSVSSSTPSVCSVSDSVVTYLSIGTCTLQASAPATATYAAATGSAQSFAVGPPTISSLSPNSGPESTPVTISGTGFGFSPNTTTITFNGAPANISSWSNTSIVAQVPVGATTGNVVVAANQNQSNGAMFTVQATTPMIVSMSASSGNAGLAVRISGSGFGSAKGQSSVSFNGSPAAVLNWSDSSITAIVPNSATTGPVVVTLSNAQQSNNNIIFTINSSSCTF